MECVRCQVNEQDRHLNKCPICFKWVCDECAHPAMGRSFCGKQCAHEFFFGDDDE